MREQQQVRFEGRRGQHEFLVETSTLYGRRKVCDVEQVEAVAARSPKKCFLQQASGGLSRHSFHDRFHSIQDTDRL
jgi:hypothetical protein